MNNPDDENSRVIFYMGSIVDTIYIDNVSLKEDVPTEVKVAAAISDEFKLYQNYPNPFNPTTTIKYEIPQSSFSQKGDKGRFVSLKVYDIPGREVAILLNAVKAPAYIHNPMECRRFHKRNLHL